MRIVIIGGGFAGLSAARMLEGKHAVTIIDERDYFTFHPFLEEYAAGLIGDDLLRIPFSKLKGRSEFMKGRCTGFDERDHIVMVEKEGRIVTVGFDYLIIAVGSVPRQVPEDIDHIYSHDAARQVRTSLERLAQRQGPMRIGIVGGGPVGMELAFCITDGFGKRARVSVFNQGSSIFAGFSNRLAQVARRIVAMRDIIVHNDVLVRSVEDRGSKKVYFQKDGRIGMEEFDQVVWCAGSVRRGIDGPLMADENLRLRSSRDVFVIGDAAVLEKGVPMLAQHAVMMGKHVAHNILRRTKGKPTLPYRGKLKGLFFTAGRRKEVGILRGTLVTGPLAWLIHKVAYLRAFLAVSGSKRFIGSFLRSLR